MRKLAQGWAFLRRSLLQDHAHAYSTAKYDTNEMAFKNLNDKEVKVRPAGELSYRQHGKQR